MEPTYNYNMSPLQNLFQREIKHRSHSELEYLIECIQEELEIRSHKAREQQLRERTGISLLDLIHEIDTPARLFNVIKAYYSDDPFFYVEDLTKKDFLKLRNAWVKSWEDLKYIINHSLKGTRFEPYQDKLKKHFAAQDRLWEIENMERKAKRESK